MSTLQVDNIKQKDAVGPAITLDSDGSVSINAGSLDTTSIKHANASTPAITFDSDGSIDVAGATNFSGSLQYGNVDVGYKNIPLSGIKTTSYQLTTSDISKFIEVNSGGSITIPNSTFATGNVILLANNTTGDITITCNTTTTYLAGYDTNVSSALLATRGLANILFLDSNACIISGNVS